MLKLPAVDICIESPRQSEYVDVVTNKKENHYMLGHGSYGRVYRAIYRDRPVAVKVVRKINEQTAASVTRESNILGWNHENIIKILKVTSLDDCFTIIMERFPGICLQQQLLGGMKIPSWHRLKIAMDVMNGVHFCHAKQLVHLDVKPQNVFVAVIGDSSDSPGTNYVCKMFDFGCSTFVNKENCSSKQRGTIRYMSPDILQGFSVDYHDDIYSFGITMWQLKSNTDPYQHIPSNECVAYQVVKNGLRPDSQSKYVGKKENENWEDIVGLNTNGLNNSERSGSQLKVIRPSRRPLTPITPNTRLAPTEMEFLSTGHVRRQIKAVTKSVTSNAVKKLDFNSIPTVKRMPFSPRSVNENLAMNELKVSTSTNDTVDYKNVDSIFKYSHRHLSTDRKMKIENSYDQIYRQCWDQEAIKRPSSQTILGLINSTFQLFN